MSVRSLVALILTAALTLSACSHAYHVTRTATLADKVASSVVRITGFKPDLGDGHDFVCTGFVLAKDRVLTAAHCLGERITADGVMAQVLRFDQYFDLALLNVPTSKPALQLRMEPVERFEDLLAVGYGFGFSRLLVLNVHSVLLDHEVTATRAPGIIVQGGYIEGMSGGPLVDLDGRVVGMIQQSNEGVGYGVGVLVFRVFLLGLM